jgi:putative transposase
MSAALELGESVGQAVACRALGVPRATLYRHMQPAAAQRVRPTPERALDAAERQVVLDHLHSERFRDKAPVEVYATLLDENIYLCSIRTMHRILAQNGELKERRNQLRHPQYKKPELLAPDPIKSGHGILRSFWAQPNGPISISTSSWTSSAAMWWAGWWQDAKLPSWPNG